MWIVNTDNKDKIKDELDTAYAYFDLADPMYVKGYIDAMMFVMRIMISKEDWEKGERGD